MFILLFFEFERQWKEEEEGKRKKRKKKALRVFHSCLFYPFMSFIIFFFMALREQTNKNKKKQLWRGLWPWYFFPTPLRCRWESTSWGTTRGFLTLTRTLILTLLPPSAPPPPPLWVVMRWRQTTRRVRTHHSLFHHRSRKKKKTRLKKSVVAIPNLMMGWVVWMNRTVCTRWNSGIIIKRKKKKIY